MSRSGSKAQKLKRRVRRNIKRFIHNNPVFSILLLVIMIVVAGFAVKVSMFSKQTDSQENNGFTPVKGAIDSTQAPVATADDDGSKDNKDNKDDEQRTFTIKPISKDVYNEDGTIDCYIDGKTSVKKLPNSTIKKLADKIDLDSDSKTVLVNKLYPLDEDYKADDLVEVDVKFSISYKDEKRNLRQEAADALKTMFESAQSDGYQLIGVSGFRSYKRQQAIYNNNLLKKGFEHTNKYSARPGRSEHQTGWAIDISCSSAGGNLTEDFIETPEGQWVKENCYRFGFIVRYPKGKEDITGYSYEPWHVRYVGYDLARFLYDNELTLDEYYGYKADLDQIQEQERKYYEEFTGIDYKPTNVPMDTPVDIPDEPTISASVAPTDEPQTSAPAVTIVPQTTKAPTISPTTAPPTKKVTKAPTKKPTMAPTKKPTKAPTKKPTKAPTKKPTKAPTKEPTKAPTKEPTKAPTKAPTKEPDETKAPKPNKDTQGSSAEENIQK